jgi:hypothetical protein
MAELVLKISDSPVYDDGDILEVYSDTDILRDWAHMLIRGTTPPALEIPFVPALFDKYCQRFYFYEIDKTYHLVPRPAVPFRHMPALPHYRPIDRWRAPLDLEKVKPDLLTHFGALRIFSDLDPTRHFLKSKSHGKNDLREFLVLYIPDAEFADEKEIKALRQPHAAKHRKFKINYRQHLNTNRTLQNLATSATDSQAFKSLITRIQADYKFSNTTRFQEVIEDQRVSMPPRFDVPLRKNIVTEKP